ncbi:sugar lactone lactonase YvrE [Arthrobacter pascens]|uniref:SMP-30/gluconolactonase/LRE family protein n=1 Tax=Arthrobacter pascens TaxID=1677 RepID=UPI00278CB7CC|nr:SMP-30/gluconolactonase/LRE family protein [Arthrobacter pascens]MDQ0680669.1 sugar lactone lactonase YvrE [Arthrobacter pascens]
MTPTPEDHQTHHHPQWKACNRTPLELGEGPRMLPDGRVVAVDILRGQLWQVDLASPGQTVLLQQLPVPLGAVAPISGSETALLAAAGDGIAVLDGGTVTWLARPEGNSALSSADPSGTAVRMNDAVCDPAGRFWAGTMALDASPGAGTLHRVNIDGSISTVLTGLTIPNGPAFTFDGSVMYLADSAAGTITRFAVEPADGTLGPQHAFATVSKGSPDGMTVDTEDHLWVAIWGAGRIHRYRPDGSLERILHVPAEQPTSICFAGDTMSTLVVTTASIGLPTPGDCDGLILSADVGISGPPTPPARIRMVPAAHAPEGHGSISSPAAAG